MGNEKKNILIIGPPDSGKQTAIGNIEGGNSRIKSYSYGSAIINNQKNFLFKSKGEEFKFYEEIIKSFENGEVADGIVILLDNSKGFRENDEEIVKMVVSTNIPHVVFSNKQDLSSKVLNANFYDFTIIPTIATEGIGVQDGLRLLLKLIEQKEQHLKVKKSDYRIRKVVNTKTMENKINDAEKLNYIMTKSDTPDICKLKMSMHPTELDKMIKTLQNRGFSNITVESKNVDEGNVTIQSYRGHQYEVYKLILKVEMMMILKKDHVEYVLKAIESIKNENIDDNIIITPIERILRIRTLEEGEEAID
jgi:signal recognition particle receptor subunit beta/nitrogen regulatory protein PII